MGWNSRKAQAILTLKASRWLSSPSHIRTYSPAPRPLSHINTGTSQFAPFSITLAAPALRGPNWNIGERMESGGLQGRCFWNHAEKEDVTVATNPSVQGSWIVSDQWQKLHYADWIQTLKIGTLQEYRYSRGLASGHAASTLQLIIPIKDCSPCHAPMPCEVLK